MSTWSTMEKAAVVAPTPRAATATTVSGKGGGATEGAAQEAQILAKDVEVDAKGAGDEVDGRVDPQQGDLERAAGVAAPPREDRAHLRSVLGPKRRREQEQQRPIGAHHARPGARPAARASLTRPERRAASARATAAPKAVMR